jgi:hypothetical protein
MKAHHLFITNDTPVGRIVDNSGIKTQSSPELVVGVDCVWAITFLEKFGSSEKINLSTAYSEVTSWSFRVAQDFKKETPLLMATVNNDIFIENDVMYIPIVTQTESVIEWLGEDEFRGGCFCEIAGYDPDGKAVFYSVIKNVVIRNVVTADYDVINTPDIYLTADQVKNLIGMPVSFNFSIDGEDWHEEQKNTDRYFRFGSIVNENVEWSDAVKFPEVTSNGGGTGGTIGFGKPSATIEILDPNATPTVSIETTGDDVAKVFKFHFGIPLPQGVTQSQVQEMINTSLGVIENGSY